MDVTLRLPRPPRTINSAPNSVEALLYCLDFLLRHPNTLRLTKLLSSSSKRLVMSSLSRSTSSSSAPPSPIPSRPSSSSSSLSNSSMTEPLSVGAIQVLHPVESIFRGDNPKGATNRSSSPEQSSPLLGLTGWILRWQWSPLSFRPRPSSWNFWVGSRFWRQMPISIFWPLNHAN